MAMTRQVKPLRRPHVSRGLRFFRAALFILFFSASFAGASVRAFAQQPDARALLRSIRMNQSGQHRALNGRLRCADLVMPFHLVLDGSEIRYEFSDQTLVLRLGENGSQLFETARGSTGAAAQKLSPARDDASVRGTDISFEDLALKFLYWPKAAIEGDELKLAQRCWKVRVEPPSHDESQYSAVVLWVEKSGGAFLQAEGYDKNGQLSKRFKVVSGQRDPETGGWMLKQMKIERVAGANTRDANPTYLEIEK